MPELFELNGKRYRIPDDLRDKFLAEYPNARSLGKEQNLNFSQGGKTYNIPQSLADKFKSQFPAATQLNVSDPSEVDRLRLLYDHASKKYDLGNYDEFYAKMHDPNKRKILYQHLSKDFDLGDFQTFESKVKPHLKQQGSYNATTQPQIIPDPLPPSTDLPLTTAAAESTKQPVQTQLMQEPGAQEESTTTAGEDEPGYLGEILRSLEIGSSRIGAGLARLPAAIYNTAAIPQNFIVSLMGREDLAVKAPDWAVDNPVSSWYDNNVKLLQAKNTYYDKGIIESFKAGKPNDAFRILGRQMAENIPQQIAILIGAYMGVSPTFTLGGMGAVAAGQKTAELQDADVPEFVKGINAFNEGALEAITETIGTHGIAKIGKSMLSKMGKEKATETLQKGIASSAKKVFEKFYPITAPIGEGIEEYANTIAQNWNDKVSIDPDRDLFQGAPDAFLVGLGSGATTTVPAYTAGKLSKMQEKESKLDQPHKTSDLKEKEDVTEITPQSLKTEQIQEKKEPVEVISTQTFRDEIKSKFTLSDEQADKVSTIAEMRAKAWAKEHNKPIDEWYASHLAEIKRGEGGIKTDEETSKRKPVREEPTEELQSYFDRALKEEAIPVDMSLDEFNELGKQTKLFQEAEEKIPEGVDIEKLKFITGKGKQKELFELESSALNKIHKSLKTNILETIQDAQIRMRRLQELPGVKVSEKANWYDAETRFHGRVGHRLEKVKETIQRIDKDLVYRSRRLQVPDDELINDVNRYLIARHTPERNAALGQQMSTGITDDQAYQIIDEIESLPHFKEIRAVAQNIQNLNNQTLDILLEGEVITQGLYDLLRDKYKNHVPLQRILEDSENLVEILNSGKGFSVATTGIKRAKGSQLDVKDILENVASNVEMAIVKAEKNLVNQAALEFAKENPGIGIFNIVKPKPIGKDFRGNTIWEKINTGKQSPVLTVRIKGRPVYLEITDRNIAEVLKGVNLENLPKAVRWIGVYSRFVSSLATRFNPEFPIPNIMRDTQEMAVYLAAQKDTGFKGAAKAVMKTKGSLRDIINHFQGKDTPGTRLYKEMKSGGGTTGGMALSTRKQLEIDIDKIRKLNRSRPRKIAQAVIEFVDNLNQVFEDATRLSAYKVAKERGLSKEESAVISKRATIDFNKKGTSGPLINALYIFSNASIQGSTKMLRAMKRPKGSCGGYCYCRLCCSVDKQLE
jgi:hypothetical protein